MPRVTDYNGTVFGRDKLGANMEQLDLLKRTLCFQERWRQRRERYREGYLGDVESDNGSDRSSDGPSKFKSLSPRKKDEILEIRMVFFMKDELSRSYHNSIIVAQFDFVT